ncbi:acyl-CoA thioesterase, partial [Tieghemiomyces parasiticus]
MDFYRGDNLWLPWGSRGVFGGQVVAQALVAATKTVSKQYVVHSLHSYFILGGDNSMPIIYQVDRVRNGRNFCTRTVSARQKGRTIFTCTCSFQIPRKEAAEHQ